MFTSYSHVKAVICILMIMCCQSAVAANFRGGDLTYTWAHDSTYKLHLTLYGPCDGGVVGAATTSVCYFNSCNGQGSSVVMMAVPVTQPAMPDYQVFKYAGEVILTSRCNDWTFYFAAAARDTDQNLKPGKNFYLEAKLNNMVAQGNSAVAYTGRPASLLAVNYPYTINADNSDPDNDSLAFEVIECRTAASNYGNAAFCQSTYVASVIPFSNASMNTVNNPFPCNNSFYINPVTGQYSFTASDTGLVSIAVRIHEYRNGTWIGSVMRDIQMNVINQIPPGGPVLTAFTDFVGLGPDFPATANGIAGSTISFCLSAYNPVNSGARLKMINNASLVLPGCTVVESNPRTDSTTLCITWNSTLADTGLHILAFSLTDSLPAPGCNTLPGTSMGPTTFSVMLMMLNPLEVKDAERAAIIVYPNPATNRIWIKADGAVQKRLRDIQGRTLLTSTEGSIDISPFSNGLYLLDIFDEKGFYIKTEKVNKVAGQ